MSAQFPNKPRERGDLQLFQVIGAVLLITLGGVFLALQAGVLRQGSNWWVIFLFVPGAGLLWNAVASHQRGQPWTAAQTIEVILGVVLVLLTIIFIFDPTWRFLNLDRLFPEVDWNRVWPFFLVIPGVLMLAAGLARRHAGFAALGAVVTLVGGVFIFDVDWNYVWPLALILPGFWLLWISFRRHPE